MRLAVLLRLAVLAGTAGLLAVGGTDVLLAFAPALLLAVPLSLDRYPGLDALLALRPAGTPVVVRRAPVVRRRATRALLVAGRAASGPATLRGPPAPFASAA